MDNISSIFQITFQTSQNYQFIRVNIWSLYHFILYFPINTLNHIFIILFTDMKTASPKHSSSTKDSKVFTHSFRWNHLEIHKTIHNSVYKIYKLQVLSRLKTIYLQKNTFIKNLKLRSSDTCLEKIRALLKDQNTIEYVHYVVNVFYSITQLW